LVNHAKFHFARQKVNFFKVKFKTSVLSVSLVKFLVFSVESKMVFGFYPVFLCESLKSAEIASVKLRLTGH